MIVLTPREHVHDNHGDEHRSNVLPPIPSPTPPLFPHIFLFTFRSNDNRWYSLPFGTDTGGGTTGPHPLAAFATLRLPTPLRATRWGPDYYPEDPFGDRDVSVLAGEEDRSGFMNSETLVTLQVRARVRARGRVERN